LNGIRSEIDKNAPESENTLILSDTDTEVNAMGSSKDSDTLESELDP
jgi:hypothetical protein